ncbi:MAG: CapA family protein [Oscillospiraceae bacterium]|nr:CapA family protein [Oscillospiraceae bacterium]
MSQDFRCDDKELERRKLLRLEMKRKREKQQRIALGTVALVVILLLVLLIRGCAAKNRERAEQAEREAAAAAVRAEASTITANLAAVGDLMCYSEQISDALKPDGTYDFSESFKAVAPYLQAADLTVGNLELNFCGPDAGYDGRPVFRAPESLAATLKDVGFDILQTANTYSIQNGLNGLTSTYRYVTEQGMQPLGTYYSKEAKTKDSGVVMKNVNGIKIAFFAYTKGMNSMTLPEDADYCVDVLYKDYNSNFEQINKEALTESINAAKRLNADVIVAMLHWGSEYETEPSKSQQEIADFLFQNGVDVILGSHSHVVGPMERKTVTVDGKDKEVFVAYSLGNFFSAMTNESTQESCVLNLEFVMDAETGETSLGEIGYMPVYMLDKGENAASPRYEILPIRSALDSSLFEEQTDTFRAAIEHLKQNTVSTLDSGK